jgi:hypothetical protein
MKLNIRRAVGTTFAMTVAAVTFAGPAHADPALLNGTYGGGDAENLWTIATTCAGGPCTGTVSSNQGWSVPTTFSGSTWNFVVTKPDGVICQDGSYAPAYISLAVDPVTLGGVITLDSNYDCPGGTITRTPFQLRKIG